METGAGARPSDYPRYAADSVPLHSLPDRLLEGLELLRTNPHGLRLPYLFRVFVELIGGILVFKKPEELEFVEQLTGIPRHEVIESLKLLDHFFAPEGTTCFYKQKDELLCLTLVPGFVRGGGSFLRQSLYGLKSYDELCDDMGWLLAKLHKATYEVLEPHLKKP